MAKQGWMELVDKGAAGAGGVGLIGLRGVTPDGQSFVYFPNEELGEDAPLRAWLAVSRKRKVLSERLMIVLFILCLAIHARDRLLERGIDVDGQGRVRLATLSALSAFAKHADALTDPEAEERFMKSLRVVFKSDEGRGLVGFTREGQRQWMFFRSLEPSQVRMAPEILDAVLRCLRPAKPRALGPSDADSEGVRELSGSFGALVALIANALKALPEKERSETVHRGFQRFIRWIPLILATLNAPTGRVALARLFMLLAFGGREPTGAQLGEFLSSIHAEVNAALESAVERRMEAERAEALRDLLSRVLQRRGLEPLSARLSERVQTAGTAKLEKWLLDSVSARSLADVFGPAQTVAGRSRSEPALPRKKKAPRAPKRSRVTRGKSGDRRTPRS